MIKNSYKCLSVFLALIILGIVNIACTKANNSYMPPTKDTLQHTGTGDSLPASGPITFLALGDSYTIGQNVQEQERFPAQTAAQLHTDYFNVASLRYIATTGWTTIDLQAAITQQNPMGPFGVVTLLIGVNDQYQHMDTAGYRLRFAQLLQTAIALAGNRTSRVFVLSIPDYSVTPFGGGSTRIRQEVDAFNAINQQITLAANVAYISITDISRQAATDQSLTANDGLHPSGKQYALWAKVLAPVMEKALK